MAEPLLDTFEPTTTTKESVQTQQSSSNDAATLKSRVGENAASALKASEREGGNMADQMSEEEQIAKVREQEQEDAWESVQSKKSKKKNRKDNDTSSEASFVPSEPAAPIQPKNTRPQTNGVKTNGAQKSQETTNRFASIESSGLKEDDWAA